MSSLKMIVLEASTLKKVGIVNAYSMVQYTKRFNQVGEWSLLCALTQENIEALKEKRILWIEGKVGGMIQYIFKDRDNDQLQVKGQLLEGMLKLRAVYPMFDTYDYPENILYEMVRRYCTEGKRKFYKLVMGEKTIKNAAKVRYQQTGENVADEAEVLCTAYDFGYDMQLLIDDDEAGGGTIRKYVFTVYHGVDRTLGNGKNKTVLLGTDFNNILSSSYTLDTLSERNYAIVAGEGEADQRKYQIVYSGVEPEDFERKEVFIDARDLQSENDGVVMPDVQYRELLTARGKERMESDYMRRESYESELRSDDKAEYVYGRDFLLGDKVTVIDKELALRMDAVISGVTVTEYGKGRIVEPILGYQSPTVYQWIKKGVL